MGERELPERGGRRGRVKDRERDAVRELSVYDAGG
jgi:hypothetical protein